jgi:hypothetical protein
LLLLLLPSSSSSSSSFLKTKPRREAKRERVSCFGEGWNRL